MGFNYTLFFGGLGSIASASTATAAWYNARRAHKQARATQDIVSGNGKGDVAHMMESMIDWQERHERQDRKNFKKVERKLDGFQNGILSDLEGTVYFKPRMPKAPQREESSLQHFSEGASEGSTGQPTLSNDS